jgi:hypothetical protein
VLIVTQGADASLCALNTSGSTIPANTLIKAHTDGGARRLRGRPADRFIGRAHDAAIPDDALGIARIQIG